MRLKFFLLCASALGAVSAASCDSRRRFLAIVESRPAVYIWQDVEVELVCRPSNAVGCRWVQDDAILSDECVLTTSVAGHYQCMQGEELVGSIQLETPPDQNVEEFNSRYSYYGYHYSTNFPPESYHLCSDTGKIIDRRFMCDGDSDCDNGEDEEDCHLPCGAPAVAEHSQLTAPVSELYPHGASVTYTCDQGFAFLETLSVFRRTCSGGLWSGRPRTCHRNAAFGREGTVDGLVMSGLGPELAVDGRTNTWAMLAPTHLGQSLTVTLETNASVETVLVRTLNPEFEVSLWGPLGTDVCPCSKNVTDLPELTGLARCECPDSAAGPTVVVVRRGAGHFTSLSVAEIAVFEAPLTSVDQCVLLDRLTHGRFERVGDRGVELVCEAGYRPSCSGVLPCGEAAAAVCLPVSCPPPPVVPDAVLRFSNGTGWSAVAQYGCAAGYQPFPADQRTEAVCGADGLWSLSHLTCLPDSDIRVVAQQLGQQHARSVGGLRTELEELLVGQQQLLRQLAQTQRRLRRLEDEVGLTSDEEAPEEVTSGAGAEEEAEAEAEVEAEVEAEAEAETTEKDEQEEQQQDVAKQVDGETQTERVFTRGTLF